MHAPATHRLLVCLLVLASVVRPALPAPQCLADAPAALNNCRYGIVGICGNLKCAKAPGERCLYSWQCGDGPYCLCGRCIGCSLRYISRCYHNANCNE